MFSGVEKGWIGNEWVKVFLTKLKVLIHVHVYCICSCYGDMTKSNKCQMFHEGIYVLKADRIISNFHLTLAYCLSVALPVSKRQMPSGNI